VDQPGCQTYAPALSMPGPRARQWDHEDPWPA